MASNNIPREEVLSDMWTLSMQKPEMMTRILVKLESDFGISETDFSEYSRQRNVRAQVDILDQRAKALEEVPGFSQIDTMSDDEILRVFEARDELNAQIGDIKRSVPTDTEWYKAGLNAEQRIEKIRGPYEIKKAEEWAGLESPLPGGFEVLAGPIQFLTELVGGPLDLGYDFKERLHERGAFTSWNPLTGFGAWDIAEFQTNPETGERGLSPELLAMEDELEELYGSKRHYDEQMKGYRRQSATAEEEMSSLNQIIMENKLIDPRILGEIK